MICHWVSSSQEEGETRTYTCSLGKAQEECQGKHADKQEYPDVLSRLKFCGYQDREESNNHCGCCPLAELGLHRDHLTDIPILTSGNYNRNCNSGKGLTA